MLVIGLTGGIGSGKSTVANLFAELGVPIIDADVIAKEITQPSSPALMDIVDHFEERLLQADGSIDRAKLRRIVFEHPEEREWLENLLHPLILEEMSRQISELNAAYCIAVIPLLFESAPLPFIDRTLLIDSPEHLQLERVASRDKASHEDAKKIMDAQAKRTYRHSQADDVINNDGKLEDLKPQIEKMHTLYLSLSAK